MLQTNDTLSILLGEKGGQTKYPISYNEISGNPIAKKILGEIAGDVGWNNNLREYNKPDAQCRYVFLAASIIPSLARKLYEMAGQYRGSEAKKVREFFEQLNGFHTDTRLATGKGTRLDHEFATMADKFYTAMLGAMEICTPTREQTTVDEDYGASDKVHTLWSYIGVKYKGIRSLVEQMLSGAGIDSNLENPYISYAAEWILAYLVCKKQLFGAEFNDISKYNWRDRESSLTEQLYEIVRNTWGETDAAKSAKAENSEDFVNLSDDANVIKDMQHLGDNTSQLTIVNGLTKFTCQQYYKVFAVDGLRQHDFKTGVGKMVYKVMHSMMAGIGNPFNTAITDTTTANQFADHVRDVFAMAAANTKTATIVHSDLLAKHAEIAKLVKEKQFDKFAELYRRYGLGSVSETDFKVAVKTLKDALAAITSTIVFDGNNDVQGATVNKTQISFTNMPPEVATFGIYSTNDRKQTMDLSTAGTITAKCFHFADDKLTISFNGSTEDGSPGSVMVDTIPLSAIRDIHDTYISSRLLPAHISRSYAWIVLCGLVAFSPVSGGDLEDSVARSPVTSSHMADVADADVYKGTRISDAAKRVHYLSGHDLSKWMVQCNFIPAESKSNLEAKINLSNMVKNSKNDIDVCKNSIIATKHLCQNFSDVIWDYAETRASKDVLSKSTIVSRLYDASPTIYDLLVGKKAEIDKMLLTYIATAMGGTDNDTTADMTLCSLMSVYDDMKSGDTEKGMYSLLTKLHLMIAWINKAIRELPEQFGRTINQQFNASGTPYNDIQQSIATLFDDCLKADKKSAFAMEHKDEIVGLRNVLVNVLGDQFTDWSSTVDNKLQSAIGDDADLVQLREKLYKIIEDASTGDDTTRVTPNDLIRLNNVIAGLMLGDVPSNKKILSRLKVPQYGIRVRVLGVLLFTAGLADAPNKIDADDEVTDEELAASDDAVFELPEGGGEEMPEVSWMSPENAGGAMHHAVTAEGDAAVNKAMSFDSIPFNDTYLKQVMSLCRRFQEAEGARDMLRKKVNKIVAIARTLPGADELSPDDNSDESWLKVYMADDSINASMKSLASKCVSNLKLATKNLDSTNKDVNSFVNEYPSYKGLMTAVLKHDISYDELQYAMNQLSNAKEQLATLVKYKSYADADNDAARREFAYTESDFSTIAQIIDVIGTYLITPQDSNDNVYDLLDVLNNMSTAIDRYSGNKLSRSIIKSAIHMVQSAIDEAKADGGSAEPDYSIVVSSIVKLINRLGKMLVTRESELANTHDLSQVNHIARPTGTGAAIDSFARTQLRGLPANKDEQAKIKTFGQTDSDEKAARMAYVNLLKHDMSQNPELSRYAYMLGTAFNAFDRVMKDERVNGKAERAFHDVSDSFTGLGLFGNMCDNDLQREVISAIIDDERSADKSYPTVTAVVDAAKSGGSFNGYSQMYSKAVGSSANILNDQKTAEVAFDENGNRTIPDKAVGLDPNTISKLVVGKDGGYVGPFDDVTDLVRMVRMGLFNKIAGKYGELDVFGDEFKYDKDKVASATNLLTAALKSLYRLCKDMDTPIADIIMASSTAGQKAARHAIMSYVSDTLGKDDDIDLNLVGMVADEPDVFPEMMSNEWSQVDLEWVNGITELFSKIPDSIDPNTLHNVVVDYMKNQAARERLAMNDDYRVVMSVIENMFRLDTATGIPTGFWGDDSTDRRTTIIKLFEELIRQRNEENDTWAKAADAVGATLMKSISEGRVDVAVGNRVFPTRAAKRRLAHLRMNPYYAVDLRQDFVDEYKKLVDKLTSTKVIVKNGSSIKLKYPGISLDRNTFGYIVKMALNWENVIEADVVERFFLALMCYLSGVRINKYMSLERKADALKADIDYAVLDQASEEIKQKYEVVDYGEMVKTSLGWFTGTAYRVLCIVAASSPDGAVNGFASSVNSLTDGGIRSLNIADALKKRHVEKKKPKGDGKGEKTEKVPSTPTKKKNPVVNPAPQPPKAEPAMPKSSPVASSDQPFEFDADTMEEPEEEDLVIS